MYVADYMYIMSCTRDVEIRMSDDHLANNNED